MSRGYSVAQTARLVCALRWVCGRLAGMFDGWAARAASAPEQAAAAVALSVLGRRLAAHRGMLDGLQPDSELMAPWRQAASADRQLAAALDEIAGLEGPSACLAVAEEVLACELADAYRQIGEHAAPHCDAALASAAWLLLHDLEAGRAGGATRLARAGLWPERPVGAANESGSGAAATRTDRADARSLFGGSRPDTGRVRTDEGRCEAVDDARVALSGAGGLVARSLLRPDWGPSGQDLSHSQFLRGA